MNLLPDPFGCLRQREIRLIRFIRLLGLLLILSTWLGFTSPTAARQHTPVLLQPYFSSHVRAKAFLLSSSSALPSHKLLFRGNPHRPEIALTFDDGPQPSSTARILTILRRFDVPATFFCVGQQALDYPGLVRQESQDGNLVEDHTWSHPDLRNLDPQTIRRQLERTTNTLSRLTGTSPRFFRPPYGGVNSTILAQATQHNLSVALWNVDPRDWARPGTRAITSRVLNTTTRGSIILLHDGGGDRSQTVAALPAIIRRLRARGFQFVTLQQLAK